ncbi:hypothetical protein ABMC88_13265 [Sulfitobacter sp. HNIBRBA2951]|uniref:hypothetical protein n=1 Tax=Sulfitobacter aquimarinus TaxID=3158557 RepID=UPI0032DE2ED3
MKHLKDPKTPINKFANSMRLMGILLLVASSIGFISYRSETENFWDIYTLFLLHLAVTGCLLAFVGETLRKILIRNSDVTQRKLYFYDEQE